MWTELTLLKTRISKNTDTYTDTYVPIGTEVQNIICSAGYVSEMEIGYKSSNKGWKKIALAW